LGNTFPFVVFCSFGAFWLGYGATLQPFYNSYSAYKEPGSATSTGIESVGFNVGIGKLARSLFTKDFKVGLLIIITAYFMIAMGILCLIYLICSIRTNLVFFLIFFTLVPAFGLLAGAFLHAAKGNAGIAVKCQEAAGAFTFVTCMCGWYILLAIMLASVDFPFDLPRKLNPTPHKRCLLMLILCSRRLVEHGQGRQ
jgi:succinate-acetate transporter protein